MSKLFDKEPRAATEEDCKRSWTGSPDGLRFRCKLCGYRFSPGSFYRLVYANGVDSPTRTGNFLVCVACNTDDETLLKRMAKVEEEGYRRFFWMVEDDYTLKRWTND